MTLWTELLRRQLRPAGGGACPTDAAIMNVALLPSPKLEPRHLRPQAMAYVRQSTLRQVLENQESTRRQYQLAESYGRIRPAGKSVR